ncbi:MAG: LuxR C-terminal-related transcriptional regulator [Muribaculaceae bacterium]|nr:LuxR C-terminal-related transcriptional regulator [Muribaculaceae bacterium]
MIDKTKGYQASTTMRELIKDNSLLLPVISRFDIAFGFGDNPIEKVCQENDVDINTFLCVCNLLSGYFYSESNVSLPSLMGYLKRAHSSFLDVTLPKIRHRLIEGINYSATNEVALLLIKFFDDYVLEVRRHMDHENNVIFKNVENLLKGIVDPRLRIGNYSISHESMAEKLNELKDLFIYHYKQKENMRLSAALFDIILCERDLLSHFDVENKLFLPLAEQLEKQLLRQSDSAKEIDEPNFEKEQTDAELLSEREKDIIRGLVRGKSTKEIADELFISVHTVSTHRRNINSKLGIHSPAGLVIYALLNHIVDINEVAPQ